MSNKKFFNPRFSTGKTKISTAEKIRRAKDYRVSGYKKFNDPFPLGFGTLPEKEVYYALSMRNIPFLYLNDIELVVPELGFDQFYQADFIIPSLRIIIEIQGAHWHSMPKTIEEDAFKFALYQQNGWKPLAWWDFDILHNIEKLFTETPELNAASHFDNSDKSSKMNDVRLTKTDTSKGIRTLNAKRGQRLLYRKAAIKVKTGKVKSYGSYTSSFKR